MTSGHVTHHVSFSPISCSDFNMGDLTKGLSREREGFEYRPVMLVEGVQLLVANGSEDFGIGSDVIWGIKGQ